MKNKGSIKTRLIVIMLVCIFGMSILAANQIYNTHRLIQLNNHSRLLLQLNNHLLQLRRHEKDFLLRKDSQYLDKFSQTAEQFKQAASQLQTFFDYSQKNTAMFIDAQQKFSNYTRLFKELVYLHKDIGLDENSGYQGEFRQSTHQLEEYLRVDNQTYLHLLLLQLRRHEKDFLLRKDMRYVQQEIDVYQAISAALKNANKSTQTQQKLLDNYQQKFLQLVKIQQTIGLDHNSGLQGEFRHQAHSIETKINLIDTNITNMIAEEEHKIERTSFVIMAATLTALIILLVKSFITLQKAFATFVMFFYRCKREYRHIDERKQGFAEFKYLAMIANEMIDARQEMENELKQAQQEISRLKSSSLGP
ncbi:hypothetical protein [Paraglaciecola sp. L3A3]|uniref:hypothetical protein n=1 Tax=Paraglaciecola sp. L3A3 TaxID=2686358 RepID=UPI00131D5FEE|nr:hypothetical protein [Paraglaciecola sp. L3A3]